MMQQPATSCHSRCLRRRALVGLLGLALLFVPLSGCDYGRMKNDEALRTFKIALPEMPTRSIPVDGGIEELRESNPSELTNPLPFDQTVVDRGKESYAFFCIQCHGPHADGYGTVGQSFVPLPADLRSPRVQDQPDGVLFYRISLGFGKHPPLYDTVRPEDRWAILRYMRFLADPSRGWRA